MTAGSDLCTACGLCCDGTLFDRVIFEPTDPPAARDLLPVAGFPQGEGFVQPCTRFEAGCCTIYADRPATCRRYRCRTLAALDDGEIDPGEADRRVTVALGLRERLLAAASGRSLRAVRNLAGEQGDLASNGALLVLLGAFEVQLDRHFRKDRQRVMQPGPTGQKQASG